MFASASVRINLNEAFSIILYQGYRPVSPNSAAINFIQSETLRRFLARRILNDFDFFADFGVVHVQGRWCCVRRNVSWPSHV
jgi:hypothetical protein